MTKNCPVPHALIDKSLVDSFKDNSIYNLFFLGKFSTMWPNGSYSMITRFYKKTRRKRLKRIQSGTTSDKLTLLSLKS